MKISINFIFKLNIICLIILSFFIDIYRSNSFLSIFLQNILSLNLTSFKIAREFFLFLLILPPILYRILNGIQKYNKKFFIFIFFISILLSITSIINFANLEILNYLFYFKWVFPFLLSLAYINSNFLLENKKFFLRLIQIVLIIILFFSLENLFSFCPRSRCSSLFFSPHSLAFNSLSCILISYKILGKELFSKNYLYIYIISSFQILISISATNILGLFVFSLPFFISANKNIISFKLKKSILFGAIISSPIVIYYFRKLSSRGAFDLTSELYQMSGAERVNLFLRSFYNADGSLNLFGRPGVFTNIGRIYSAYFGEYTDSIYTSLVGNLGIIILPILLIIIFIVLSNYLILLKNSFKISGLKYVNNSLIILSILASGIGTNIFEVIPFFPILACIIFSKTHNIELSYKNNYLKK